MAVATIIRIAPNIMENFRPSPSVIYGANGYAHNDPMLFEDKLSNFYVPKMEVTDLNGIQ